jgi:ABC-type Co2+ transport system permease subunit
LNEKVNVFVVAVGGAVATIVISHNECSVAMMIEVITPVRMVRGSCCCLCESSDALVSPSVSSSSVRWSMS